MASDLLTYHVEMRTPLVWVNSDEGLRVTEAVIDAAGAREVYRMSGFDGLCRWNAPDASWKQCLFQNEEHQMVPLYNMQVALNKLHDRREQIVFIFDHAHETAKENVLALHELSREFATLVAADNFDDLGLQIILISGQDKIPPELARDVTRIEFSLPTKEELGELVRHIEGRLPQAVVEGDEAQIVRAGQGLTRNEFNRSMLESIRVSKVVEPDYVNRAKVDIIKAGGLLEIRRPIHGIESVGGLDNLKQLLNRIYWLWEHGDEAKEMGVTQVRRVLLVGVPGSGKSLVCEVVARSLGLDLAVTGVSKAMSKWVGESEQNMRTAFRQVAAMAPIVMWVDEFGRDMSGSGVSNDSGTTDRVHGEFLTGLQELPHDVFLFAAANRIDGLPPEMLRADRFDQIMFIGFPTTAERADVFKIHLGEHAEEFDLAKLAMHTNTWTGAEIKALINKTRFEITPVEHRPITTDDLINVSKKMRGRVWVNHHEQCIEMYKRARSEWEWASTEQEAVADNVINAPKANPTSPNVPSAQNFSNEVHDIAAKTIL